MTEIHAAMPIIGGISELQLLKIHCGFLLQCSPTPRALPIHSDASRCRDSVHLYEEFSGACCYQDIIQRGYKMNAGQTLTYSKWLPNFRTIGILLLKLKVHKVVHFGWGNPRACWRSKFCTQGDPILYASLCGILYATNIWQFVRKFYMGVLRGLSDVSESGDTFVDGCGYLAEIADIETGYPCPLVLVQLDLEIA